MIAHEKGVPGSGSAPTTFAPGAADGNSKSSPGPGDTGSFRAVEDRSGDDRSSDDRSGENRSGENRGTVEDRRKRRRRGGPGSATIMVVDGPLAGTCFDTITREVAGEINFLLKAELRVGQTIRIETETNAGRVNAEVVRCRPLATGRFEVAAEVRRAAERMPLSHSQRRHMKRARMI